MILRKPKLLKLPKKPKRSASIAELERYVARVEHVRRENASRTADHRKKLKRLAELRRRVFSSRPVSAIAQIKTRRAPKKARRSRKRRKR